MRVRLLIYSLSKRAAAGLIALVGLSLGLVLTVPSFVFNERELESRFLIKAGLGSEEVTDRLISVRRLDEPVMLSTTQRNELPEVIEETIESGIEIVREAQHLTKTQRQIPFLPGNYREYLKLKERALERYVASQVAFLRAKRIEHRGAYITQQLVANEDHTREESVDVLANYRESAAIAKVIVASSEEMLRAGELTEGLHGYYAQRSRNVMDLYAYFASIDDWDSLDGEVFEAKLDEIASRGSEVDFMELIGEWREVVVDPVLAVSQRDYEEWLELAGRADGFYREKGLARDAISVLLSKVSAKFPRNI